MLPADEFRPQNVKSYHLITNPVFFPLPHAVVTLQTIFIFFFFFHKNWYGFANHITIY